MEQHVKPLGRPRNETIRRTIIGIAARLAQECGYHHVTLKDVASQAGVGRQTLYRWWPTKHALYAEVLNKLLDTSESTIRLDQLGLEQYLCAIFRLVQKETGSITMGLCVDAQHNAPLRAQLAEIIGRRRLMLVTMLKRLAAEHRQHFCIPVDIAAEMLAGAMWYRMLHENGPLDDHFAHALTKAAERLLTTA